MSPLLLLVGTAGAKEGGKLFEYVDSGKAQKQSSLSLRDKAVFPISLNEKFGSAREGDVFTANLPSTGSISIRVESKKFARNGDIQITGRFGDDGAAVFTIGKNSVYANIHSQALSYGIGVEKDGSSFLVDHRLSDSSIELADDMWFPNRAKLEERLTKSQVTSLSKATAENKSVITMLMAYSSEFANGFADPISRINQMLLFSNDAYLRSGIHIELVLAHAVQIGFDNSRSTGSLLQRATNGSNGFTNLHALRDQYYADMVAVLPFTSSGSISGTAWVNGDSASSAFSVSRFALFGSDSLFAHEVGHNLGSGHERVSANPSQSQACTGGFTGYSCGHGNGSEGTIMSYLDDGAWEYVFSNPTLDCDGEPCGIAEGQSNSADNASSFNVSGPLIELFRVDTSNDDDKDGVENDQDNCPNVSNANQANNDGDSQGDACDDDDDDDLVDDLIDNCPLIANPLQLDSNLNNVGDACESEEVCFPVKRAASASSLAVICL